MDTVRNVLQYNVDINNKFRDLVIPIISQFGFNELTYTKFYGKQGRLFFSTNLGWANCYVGKQFYSNKIHECNVVQRNDLKYAIWDSFKNDVVFEAAKAHNQSCGLYIYNKNELFCLSATTECNQSINFTINNLNLVNHFLFYFKSLTKYIMPSNTKNLNMIMLESQNVAGNNIGVDNNKILEVMPLTSGLSVVTPDIGCYLSNRQLQVFSLIAYGKTNCEISGLLKISEKTVDKHILTMKSKFNCISKFQLVEIYHKSNLKELHYCSFLTI